MNVTEIVISKEQKLNLFCIINVNKRQNIILPKEDRLKNSYRWLILLSYISSQICIFKFFLQNSLHLSNMPQPLHSLFILYLADYY